MAINLTSNKNQRIHYWTQFKEAVAAKRLSLQYEVDSSRYVIWAHDGPDMYVCYIWIDAVPVGITQSTGYSQEQNDLDKQDFDDNFKDYSNLVSLSKVQSQFERDDIVLKLACMKGTANLSGDLTLTIKVPGTYGVDYRYVAGGYAYVDTVAFGTDKITKIEVVDVDNITGLGANTVVKQYHDSEVSSSNQGWYFYPFHNNAGEIEIEPMGWYGALPAELYLQITFKVSSLKTVIADIWWGKIEP